MKNRETDAAWQYHNGTKHSYQSVRTSPHYLDWDNQPIPLKIYSALEPIPLPEHLSSSGMPALSAIVSGAVETAATAHAPIARGNSISFRRSHPAKSLSGRRDALSRGGLHGRALSHRSLSCLRRSGGSRCRSLPIQSARFLAATFASRGLSFDFIRCQRRRILNCQRALRDRQRVHVLAQCLEVPGARLSPLLLGQRHDRRQSFGRFGGAQDSSKGCPRLCRCDSESAFGSGQPARGAAFARGAGPIIGNEDRSVSADADAGVGNYTAIENRSRLPRDAERCTRRRPWKAKRKLAAWREETRTAEGERIKDEDGDKQIFPLQLLSNEDLPQDTIEEVIVRRGSTREFSRDSITLCAALDHA